jgi:hypothetical protein
MFHSKQSSLFDVEKKKASADKKSNGFLSAAGEKSAETLSGNYAKKYSTTGNDFVDQFGKLGSMREPRPFEEIAKDMSILWAKNPEKAVKFLIYIRLITRTTMLYDGKKTVDVQRGAGLKHEGIMRMIWLYMYHPNAFWKNIYLFIAAGSWKDVFQMLSYDLEYNGWNGRQLDWEKLASLITAGLTSPDHSELIKKYLPQIKAKSKCTTLQSQADTLIGKWLASKLFFKTNYKKYRKLKSSGTAHQWQKLISQRRFLEIDFDTVHGRALAQMVSGKFLENQGLEQKFDEWMASKPIAKFTGFPHELFGQYGKKVGGGFFSNLYLDGIKPYQARALNKQFYGLVETAQKGAETNTSMIVVRDTSGSMGSEAKGANMASGDIAKALALFFSYMLPDGFFANSWIEFSSKAKLHEWKGSTPVEKWQNDNSSYIGNTDFLSVVKLFAEIKTRKGVDESEFPTGIICISDGEFDPASLDETNLVAAKRILRDAGFSRQYVSNFKVILWNLQSRYYGDDTGEKFETYGGEENTFYFSGYDASVMAFLTGLKSQNKVPKTAEDLFEAAMDQELLNQVEV